MLQLDHPRRFRRRTTTLVRLALVLTAGACADQSATQYVGTAMDESSPERAGSLTLTLFSRTDTSFTGIMEVGPPVKGTGSAYAWYEGPEFHVVTVAATGGDTILWTSKLADEGLGGKYTVTGGPREGQGGTWQARLTRGLPATAATLRLPRTTPPPPLSATWPLALLVLVAGGIIQWVRRTPRPVAVDATALAFKPWSASIDSGISGWLLLFVVAQVVAVLSSLMRYSRILSEYRESIGVSAVVTGMRPMLVVETTIQLVLPAFIVLGLVLIVRHSRYAPRFWFGYLLTLAVYLAVDRLLMLRVESELTRLVGATYAEESAKYGPLRRSMVAQIVTALVWATYWTRSMRARATFGVAALDRTAAPIMVATGVELAAPPPPKRRWRLVLRGAGVVVAALLIVAAIGLMKTRVTPFSVAAGEDIRKTIAGQWTWTTDSSGCANAHTIAFSDDGKVMTIVQPSRSVGSTDVTTTYDLSLVTQSSIRGAIRGESRRTGDGTPVVWDLVLVGPNAYRWHRTDWFSSWGYTPAIVRCPSGDSATDAPKRAAP